MKNYYFLLDPLRFFAAFWVMNFHYLFVLGTSDTVTWYRYGNLGVQLFFIISGFVIVESMQDKTRKEVTKSRRIRLFPLFWILCTATYALTFVIPAAHHASLGEYLISMTMWADVINGFFGNNFHLVDPSYWTLTVELIFYIGIGIVTYLFSWKNLRYFLLLWLLISACAFVYKVDENFYVKLLLVRHASYFIFGSSLALLTLREARSLFEKYFDWGLVCTSALYSLFINARAIPKYSNPNPLDPVIVSSILIGIFMLVCISVYFSQYVKNARFITTCIILGGITYPLYLLHQTIGNALINYVANTYGISWTACAIGFEACIILCASLVYREDKKIRFFLKQSI